MKNKNISTLLIIFCSVPAIMAIYIFAYYLSIEYYSKYYKSYEVAARLPYWTIPPAHWSKRISLATMSRYIYMAVDAPSKDLKGIELIELGDNHAVFRLDESGKEASVMPGQYVFEEKYKDRLIFHGISNNYAVLEWYYHQAVIQTNGVEP